MLSYPQKESGFPNWIGSTIGTNEVEYYEVNDTLTLGLVQGIGAFLFDKDDLKRDRDESRIGVKDKDVYRVFFYNSTKFALIYGDRDSSGSIAELYDVSVNGRDP